MKTVEVKTGANRYEIRIGPGLFKRAGGWLKDKGFSGKLVIITNPVVGELYGDELRRKLEADGFRVSVLEVPDGEERKSLQTAGRLYRWLTAAGAERGTPIIALGGGVIGDLAGFVAATYLRGVPLVQCPTTLLAQVDSSIGGKVAVDHGRLKNIIGAFYQPVMVVADTGALRTLPEREVANGLAEIIKSAAIRDRRFFSFLEENMDRLRALESDVVEETVYRTARIKAAVVSRDERDSGLRHILNFGHTIGHAVEAVSGFRVAHGQAVAVGMVAAARISQETGLLSRRGVMRLRALVERAGLPAALPGLDVRLDARKIISAMKYDKKVKQGRVRFVLLESIGKATLTDGVSPELVERVLAADE